ncbi:molybdopterin dinucleotide binding domain-containing protein [Nocardioides convexus]|uniref:molybdopterin dinucleotide binding domain-containing protein n=1 Tax=Nocardioides convexus TaxID=2712224 RepID=UPI0024189DCD|nr:molybdopterin dinucleotide binding domain-containing protein [Nocardioides convexus]
MHNTDRLTKGRPRHHLLMHPADLDARGLVDGTLVTVTSRVGKVEVEVKATEDVMPGVVSLPHGYGHQREGVRLGIASRVAGVSINDLTDPERLDVSGNAALSGVPVTVRLNGPERPTRPRPARGSRRSRRRAWSSASPAPPGPAGSRSTPPTPGSSLAWDPRTSAVLDERQRARLTSPISVVAHEHRSQAAQPQRRP